MTTAPKQPFKATRRSWRHLADERIQGGRAGHPTRETVLALATNGVTKVQAAEVRLGGGVFWGVQYHPELPLYEIADALRRQGKDILEQGFARETEDVESYASVIEALGQDPTRRDLAWRLGVNEQVTDPALRQTELRNFIQHLVGIVQSQRGRV